MALGECHRYPPTRRSEKDRGGVWPLTCGYEWCGEFEEEMVPAHSGGYEPHRETRERVERERLGRDI